MFCESKQALYHPEAITAMKFVYRVMSCLLDKKPSYCWGIKSVVFVRAGTLDAQWACSECSVTSLGRVCRNQLWCHDIHLWRMTSHCTHRCFMSLLCPPVPNGFQKPNLEIQRFHLGLLVSGTWGTSSTDSIGCKCCTSYYRASTLK